MKNSTNGVDNLGFEKDQNDGVSKKPKYLFNGLISIFIIDN